MREATGSLGLGSLASGAITALATAVQTGLAALVGVILAREFGRGPETDGFFAAYGVFVVCLLAATSVRVTLLPALARARSDNRLASATTAYAVSVSTVALPALALAILLREPIADLLTGTDAPALASETAADLLPWMLLAATFQLYAGLLASALAALNDYAVAASGYVAGSVLGLVLIVWRLDADGVVSIAWGMALNGVIALALPAAVLLFRARAERMPGVAVRPAGGGHLSRLGELGGTAVLPLALQALYLICIPLAAREGVGGVTSFGYAYLIAAALVGITASSLALVTSVPLTRGALDPARAARHIVSSSWVALAAIAVLAGIFGVAGGQLVERVLGPGYGADVGDEVGRLVVLLSLWAVTAVGVSVTYPLVIIGGRAARLGPVLSIGLLLLHVPVAFAGQVIGGLDGLAVAMAVTTLLMLLGLLGSMRATGPTLRGLGLATATTGALAAVAFVGPALVLEPAVAAVAGAGLYGVLLAVLRPPGLLGAWRYLRTLG
jgi:hypothetical protein